MRKLLFVLGAIPLVLTGCLKTDNYASKLAPVARGLEIYNFVDQQKQITMQPVEVGIRLAMLLAEAEKRESMDDLDGVLVDDVWVKNYLFGMGTKIEKTSEGYKIIYANTWGLNDTYVRNGVFYVATNGAEQLSETEVGSQKKWVVSVKEEVMLHKSSWDFTFNISDGSTVLYNVGDGTYRIDISGFRAYFSTSPELKSNWSGGFNWKPADAELTYSGCVGKESGLSGEANGESFYALNPNSVPTYMWYRVADGRMHSSGAILSGVEESGFSTTADYDTSRYPAPNVKVEWSYDEKSGLSYIFTWNGISVSMP